MDTKARGVGVKVGNSQRLKRVVLGFEFDRVSNARKVDAVIEEVSQALVRTWILGESEVLPNVGRLKLAQLGQNRATMHIYSWRSFESPTWADENAILMCSKNNILSVRTWRSRD